MVQPSQSSTTLTEDVRASSGHHGALFSSQHPPSQLHQQYLPQPMSVSSSAASFTTTTTAATTSRPFANANYNVQDTEADPSVCHHRRQSIPNGEQDPPETDASIFSTAHHHPTSRDPLFMRGAYFKDRLGRTTTLRGVNLSGASKMPVGCPSHQENGFLDHDGRKVTFVGRPFPLEDADEHLSRLQQWGFNILRFIVTWEAIEHAGPGLYDTAFFEYLVAVLFKCKQYGFKCFIDPHQDVWSRFTGGSGAPLWTLYLAGLDPRSFNANNAALVHNTYPDPENFPKMVWATNYNKLAAATMFTLFFAGSTFAPNCVVDQMNIQDYLQTHYIKSYMALAEYITQQDGIEDDVVIGYDTLNEPSAGWIGVEDLTKIPDHQELKKELTPTPLQAMILGMGFPQSVEYWVSSFFGPKRKGSKTVDPQGVAAWLSEEDRLEKDKVFGWDRSSDFPKAGQCIWADHGVWDVGTLQVLDTEYFLKDPDTQESYSFDSRSFLPFCRRFAQAIRTIHKSAIIFLEPPVNEIPPSLPPPHEDDDRASLDLNSRVVYAPHWYDGLTLLNKKWNFFNIDYLGVKRGRYPNYASAVKIGEKAIRECFRNQLACIKDEGQAALGMHPTLIGEIGIPYDMGNGQSYKPKGNYKDQIKAMDANMYALESNHLNFTLWNYCADNSHKWGDLWNGEDLSLWSNDDIDRDPRRYNSGTSLNSMAERDDMYSLQNVVSTDSTAVDSVEYASRNKQQQPGRRSPRDQQSANLTRRSSASLSSSIASSDPPSLSVPVNKRVAVLSNSSGSSSSSSSSSSSTSPQSRPGLHSLDSSTSTSSVNSSTPMISTSKNPLSKKMGFNSDLNRGARALVAFCRPFAPKVAGEPVELSFSLNTVVFKFSFRTTPAYRRSERSAGLKKGHVVNAPTEIYLPSIHFPSQTEFNQSLSRSSSSISVRSAGASGKDASATIRSNRGRGGDQDTACSVTVSGGRWSWRDGEQTLYWWTDEEEDEEGGDNADEPEDNQGKLYEITVVGKKWTGNGMARSASRNVVWNAISQCCQPS